jgi:hypothetical protein
VSLEVDVFLTNEPPPLADFIASLKPTRRALCKGERWDSFVIGHARVSFASGAEKHERWSHAHARHLTLSGSAAGNWQDILFVLWDLVDVCGGAVRTGDEMFDHERRISPPDVVEARLAAIRAAKNLATLRAAFDALDHLDDPPLFRRCAALALAEATSGRDELWEPIVKLAKHHVAYLEDVEHDGRRLIEWLATRKSEGAKLKPAVLEYIDKKAYLLPGS